MNVNLTWFIDVFTFSSQEFIHYIPLDPLWISIFRLLHKRCNAMSIIKHDSLERSFFESRDTSAVDEITFVRWALPKGLLSKQSKYLSKDRLLPFVADPQMDSACVNVCVCPYAYVCACLCIYTPIHVLNL